MDAGRYPELVDLYACWFHEDWQLEHGTADDVLRSFVRHSDPGAVVRLQVEIRALLATDFTEEDLVVTLGPFHTFRPGDYGQTIRTWLNHLLVLLAEPPDSN